MTAFLLTALIVAVLSFATVHACTLLAEQRTRVEGLEFALTVTCDSLVCTQIERDEALAERDAAYRVIEHVLIPELVKP